MKLVPIEGLDSMSASEILLTKIKLARKFPEDSSYVIGLRRSKNCFGYVATYNEHQVNPVGHIDSESHQMYPIGASGFIVCSMWEKFIEVEQLYAVSKHVAMDLIQKVEKDWCGCVISFTTLNFKDKRKNKLWSVLGYKPEYVCIMTILHWSKYVNLT